jgi:hypothetical protein
MATAAAGLGLFRPGGERSSMTDGHRALEVGR